MLIHEVAQLYMDLQGKDLKGYDVVRGKYKAQYQNKTPFDIAWARRLQDLKKIFGYKKPNAIETSIEKQKRDNVTKLSYDDAVRRVREGKRGNVMKNL